MDTSSAPADKIKMTSELKSRMIMSVIGLVMALFGLTRSISLLPYMHDNTTSLGIWIAVYLAGTIMAYVSVMPTPAKYQTAQVQQAKEEKQAEPSKPKNTSVTDIILGIALIAVGLFFIYLSLSSITIIFSIIMIICGAVLIYSAAKPDKK